MRRVRNGLCRVLIFSLTLFSMQNASAELIRTDEALPLLGQLERLGVSPMEARGRIAAMTEEEQATLSREIQSLPAGGNLGYEIVFAATGIIIVAGLVLLVWVLVQGSRESAAAPAG